MRFPLVGLSTPSVSTLRLKGGGSPYQSGNSSDGRVGSLEQVALVLATQRQEKLPVNI